MRTPHQSIKISFIFTIPTLNPDEKFHMVFYEQPLEIFFQARIVFWWAMDLGWNQFQEVILTYLLHYVKGRRTSKGQNAHGWTFLFLVIGGKLYFSVVTSVIYEWIIYRELFVLLALPMKLRDFEAALFYFVWLNWRIKNKYIWLTSYKILNLPWVKWRVQKCNLFCRIRMNVKCN